LTPGVDGYAKSLYHWKIIWKTQKASISYWNFCISFARGRFASLPPVSYATQEEIRSQIVEEEMNLFEAPKKKPNKTLLNYYFNNTLSIEQQ